MEKNSPKNVFLIILDALRFDYSAILMEKLRKYGFTEYNNAISSSPWTTPSHASMITGVYPLVHGAHESKDRKYYKVRLTRNLPTLQQKLKMYGYRTYLLSENPFISPIFGFRGFDEYHNTLRGFDIDLLSIYERQYLRDLRDKLKTRSRRKILIRLLKNRKISLIYRSILTKMITKTRINRIINRKWPLDKGGEKTVNTIKGILKKEPKSKKFFFINFMETHEPYFIDRKEHLEQFINSLIGDPLDENYLIKWKQGYERSVSYISDLLDKLLGYMYDEKELDNSLIIITSDHGQLLGEHGKIAHGVFLCDELLRVPFLIKYPDYIEEPNITPQHYKYLSNTSLKKFVVSHARGSPLLINDLYEDHVYSETFGVHLNYKDIVNLRDLNKIIKWETYRIAIYYKGMKAIYNISTWNFDKLLTYNKNSIDQRDLKFLKKLVITHLSKAKLIK
ncbi:MAG: sulfatase-like hydrolase/transferase [Desulfurococcales archaeon]|nr:sulfatase-like hydrolase/transferase [Desulfurococcales archaeon]